MNTMIKVLVVIFCIFFFVIGIRMFFFPLVYHFSHPEMTQMQIFAEYGLQQLAGLAALWISSSLFKINKGLEK